MAESTLSYRLISGAFAFLMWGGWSFWINSANGIQGRVVSGLVQGTASFLITLVMVHSVTRLYNGIGAWPLNLVAPAVVTVACTGTGLVGIHLLAGTPEIASTVAPPLTVAFLYCLYTTQKLHGLSKEHNND